MNSQSQNVDRQVSRGRGRPPGEVPFYKQETRFSVALYLVLTDDLKLTKESAARLAVFFAAKETKKARDYERLRNKATQQVGRVAGAASPRQLSELEYVKISPEFVTVRHISRQPDRDGTNLIRKAEKVRRDIGGCPQSRDWLFCTTTGLRLLIAGMSRNNLAVGMLGVSILRSQGWERHLIKMMQIITEGRDVDLSADPSGDKYRKRLEKINRRVARRRAIAK